MPKHLNVGEIKGDRRWYIEGSEYSESGRMENCNCMKLNGKQNFI
jgi:hypothetical protein